MICGSRGSKSRLAKAAGAEPAGQMRDEKLHAVVEAYFQVKMYKTHHGRTAFGSCDVGKVHAVVARSTFPRQNVKKNRDSDHFWRFRCRKVHAVVARSTFPCQNVQKWSDHSWTLRCRKSARRCGAKHISTSKCLKKPGGSDHFWRFRCRKVHAVVARSTFRSQNVKNTRVRTTFGGSDIASLRFASLDYTTLHYTTLHYTTLHYTPQHYNYDYTTTFHDTPLH